MARPVLDPVPPPPRRSRWRMVAFWVALWIAVTVAVTVVLVRISAPSVEDAVDAPDPRDRGG